MWFNTFPLKYVACCSLLLRLGHDYCLSLHSVTWCFFFPQETVSGYVCKCESGWTGVNCTENINECLSNPCLNGGTCVDGVNAFNCECTHFWTGFLCHIPQEGTLNISYTTDAHSLEVSSLSPTVAFPLNNLLSCSVAQRFRTKSSLAEMV